MSFYKFLYSTAHFCLAPNDGDGSASNGGNGGGDEGGDKKSGSMLDTDAIKKSAGDMSANDQGNDQKPEDKPDDQKPADKPGQETTRPDWLKDDKFWDDEKGAVKTDLIYKNLTELQGKFSRGDHKAPEKPEDYKFDFNEDQKKMLFGAADANPADDETLKSITTWGAKHKVSQDAMKELISTYAEAVAPAMEKLEIDIEAERAALGKNADAVIKNQMDFFGHLYRSGHINDKHLEELRILGETAAGIQAIQAIRTYYGEQPIPTNINTSGEGMPSKEELSAMLNDAKYGEDKDFTAKVDALYAKRYGNAPAMSSAQNR